MESQQTGGLNGVMKNFTQRTKSTLYRKDSFWPLWPQRPSQQRYGLGQDKKVSYNLSRNIVTKFHQNRTSFSKVMLTNLECQPNFRSHGPISSQFAKHAVVNCKRQMFFANPHCEILNFPPKWISIFQVFPFFFHPVQVTIGQRTIPCLQIEF